MASGSSDMPDMKGSPELSCWTDDDRWQQMLKEVAVFPGVLTFMELCAGLGTLGIVLDMLLGHRAKCVGQYDTDRRLQWAASGPHQHYGVSGDLLKFGQAEISAMPFCHVVAAGPPCPPWSALGNRDSFDDERSVVFWTCIDIVIHQAKFGKLLFFVLENVKGITEKTAGDPCAPSDMIMETLKKGLGHGWSIELMHLNTINYGLPHRRPRVYMVGRRMRAYPLGPPSPILPFVGRVPLRALIDMTDNAPKTYTDKQKENIKDYKNAFRAFMVNPKYLGQFAIVDASRTPGARTKWRGSKPTVDVCECLTASGPALHVFSVGEGMGSPASVFGHRPLKIDRPMRISERAALQGFPSEVAKAVDENVGKLAFGNAMSVPVLGTVIARELGTMLQGLGADAVMTLLRLPDMSEADAHEHVIVNTGGPAIPVMSGI